MDQSKRTLNRPIVVILTFWDPLLHQVCLLKENGSADIPPVDLENLKTQLQYILDGHSEAPQPDDSRDTKGVHFFYHFSNLYHIIFFCLASFSLCLCERKDESNTLLAWQHDVLLQKWLCSTRSNVCADSS
jgi:hypothetical protein